MLLAIVIIAVAFQIGNRHFLSAGNLVNLLEQSTVFMVLAMAEIFALLLAEIDLSVGLVMGLGAVVVCELVQPPPSGLELAVVAGDRRVRCSCARRSALIQGTLVARLRMPSFIVTLGGLLILEGVAIIILGGSGLVGISNPDFSNEVALYDIFWGRFDPTCQLDRARRGAGGDRRGVLAQRLTQTPQWSGRPSGEPDRAQDRAPGGRRDRCRRDLQREPGALRSHRRCAA